MTSARLLRADAVLLLLFGLSGLTLDLVGYTAGGGAFGPLLRDNPLTIGVVATSVHALLVVANLAALGRRGGVPRARQGAVP